MKSRQVNSLIIFSCILVLSYCVQNINDETPIINLEDGIFKIENKYDTFQSKKQFIKIETLTKSKYEAINQKIIKLNKSNYRIIVEKNPLLKLDFKDITKYLFYKQCLFKTGIINMVIKRPRSYSKIIKTLPVYAIINATEISIYNDLKESNLRQNIKLDNILRVDQHYLNTYCFDIIQGRNEINQLRTNVLTLCGNNKKEFDLWLKVILEFKQCKINLKNFDKTKALVNFRTINNAVKKNVMSLGDNKLSDLYYDGEDKFYKNSFMNDKRSENFKKALESIKQNSIRGNISKQQIRRQYLGRMANSRSLNENILNREQIMRKSLDTKISNEREKEFSILRHMHQPKEMKLLMNVVNKIQNIKVN